MPGDAKNAAAGAPAQLERWGKILEEIEESLDTAHSECLRFHTLSGDAATAQRDAWSAAAPARKKLRKLCAELKGTGLSSASEGGAGEIFARCGESNAVINRVEAIRPLTGSVFVRLFLGRVNVRVFNEEDRKRLRSEYHKFKDRTTVIYILFPLAMLTVQYFQHYLRDSLWTMRFQHLWMLYYYVSLAIRENILRVNGSRIMGWWITHHHLAAVGSLTCLTWPDGPAYRTFKQPYLYFCVLQGFVQLIQNHYQKKRHYTLRALGKAKDLDISSTETLAEPPPLSLAYVLVPVFAAQAVQVYMGIIMLSFLCSELDMRQSPINYREELQALVTGTLAMVLGVGNFAATLTVLHRKLDRKRKND